MLFVSLGIAGTHLVEPARYGALPKSPRGSTNLHAKESFSLEKTRDSAQEISDTPLMALITPWRFQALI